jgi:hypothetical protein
MEQPQAILISPVPEVPVPGGRGGDRGPETAGPGVGYLQHCLSNRRRIDLERAGDRARCHPSLEPEATGAMPSVWIMVSRCSSAAATVPSALR